MPKYFICFLLLLSCINLDAQVYNVAMYSLDEGLHHTQVMAIMQDKRGYLWLGTHRGVSKFDGNNFKVFEASNSEIQGNFVSALLQDSKGDIWVGTEEGLNRFHPNTFKRYKDPDEIKGDDIKALLEDSNGKLWIGGFSGNLYHKHQGKYLTNSMPWINKPKEISILSFEESPNGRIWVGTSKGLFYFEPQEAGKGIQAFGQKDKMSSLQIFDILSIRKNECWIGTQKGAFKLNLQNNSYESISSQNLGAPNIYCLALDDFGQIWVGTGKGVFRYKDGEFYEVSATDRMLDVQVRTFLIDKEGDIWAGTDGSGMRKITEGSFVKYNVQDGFSSNIAKSFLEDDAGRIWVSSRDRGIDIFNGKMVIQSFSTADNLGGDAICTSFEDRNGNFWFASYNGSLSRYKNGRFTSFQDEEGLECSAVYCIAEDDAGGLWVGTDKGVFRKKDEIFERVYYQGNGLVSDIIYSLLFDNKGRLWIGTSNGIAICEGEDIENMNSAKEAAGSNIFTMIEDPKGRIWTGSSTGLDVFQSGQKKHVRISGASGAQTVVSLLIENKRFLWIGTERGVFKLNLDTFDASSEEKPDFEYYSKKDGLPSLECNANAIFQDSKGNIWFGTSEGASFIPAGTVRKEESFRPSVYITEVNSSISQDSSWEALGFELDERGLPKNLSLAPTDNRVDISFIGISLKSPKQVEYKIKLEGVDNDWIRPRGQTIYSYPNLDPGKYIFKVTAKMETEPWREDIYSSFEFEIRPPIWQRWYFLLPMSMLFLGILYLVYLAITFRRRQMLEETKIRNTAEKLQLEHQALYAMMNPHFTFNALQSIQYFIHRQDKKAANKFLSSFAKLIRKNLESTKSDFISLSEELDRLKLYLSLEKMRFPEKFDYEVNSDAGIDLSEIQIPPMILQPFVENSIKHGIMPLDANGMIYVELHKLNDDYLSINIKDNGIGIEASKIQRADRPNDHVSKGMQITLDRLALFARMTEKKYSLDIKEIVSEKGEVQGTQVEMIIPIKQ